MAAARNLLFRLRWFLGGCIAVYAIAQFAQGLLLWKLAEWLQRNPNEPREDD